MKLALCGLLIAISPEVARIALAEEAPKEQRKIVRVISKGDGSSVPQIEINGQRVVEGLNDEEIVVEPGAEGAPQIIKVVRADGGAAGAGGKKNMTFVKKIADPDAANRGWLGVTIIETPEALAAQLEAKENGVLIANVAKGSPAEAAGFQAHDVVQAINGKTVGTEVGGAIKILRSFNPGDTLTFTVLRNGQQQTLSATLGTRPTEPGQIEWKFEGPEGKLEEHTTARGKMLLRGPGGTWTMKDLGDLKNFQGLPQGVAQLLPDTTNKEVQVMVEDGKRVVNIKVQKDGGTIAINQGDDEITVTRTDAGGQTSSATYEDEDALAAADPEASELLNGIGHNVVVNLDDDGDGMFDIDIQATLGDARESYESAMENFHEAMAEWRANAGVNQEELLKLHNLMMEHKGQLPMALGFAAGKPKQSFEVRPDGTIEVRVRKGDSELVQLYSNEADLAKRNPEMSERYQSLKSERE